MPPVPGCEEGARQSMHVARTCQPSREACAGVPAAARDLVGPGAGVAVPRRSVGDTGWAAHGLAQAPSSGLGLRTLRLEGLTGDSQVKVGWEGSGSEREAGSWMGQASACRPRSRPCCARGPPVSALCPFEHSLVSELSSPGRCSGLTLPRPGPCWWTGVGGAVLLSPSLGLLRPQDGAASVG